MTEAEIKERVEHYMSMPYTKVIKRDTDGDYVAVVYELDGCVTHASTEEEALHRLDEVQRAWIRAAIEAEQQLPVAYYVDHPVDVFRLVTPVADENGAEFIAFAAGKSYIRTVADDDYKQEHIYWAILPTRLTHALEAYSTWVKDGRPYPLQNKRKRYRKDPWNPINTAPMDGQTEVLLYAEEGHLKIWGQGYFYKGGEHSSGWIAHVTRTVPPSNRAGSFDPQYWMPMLPEPVK